MVDVFPRRNLPDDAIPWGRAVEDRIVSTERTGEVVRASLGGLNRSTASSLGTLAGQIRAIPITDVLGERSTGFSVSTAYTTKVSLSIPPMEGRSTSVFFNVEAGVEMTDAPNVSDIYMRVLVNGDARPEGFMPFAGYGLSAGGGNRTMGTSSGAITFASASPAVIEVQIRSTNASMTPARAANYASITTMLVYSGA